MRNHFLNCKVCGSVLQKSGRTMICKCGWNISFNRKALNKKNGSVIRGIALTSLGIMMGFAYLGSWGSSSLKIIPLKVQELTGSLNKQSFENLRQICFNLKKYSCVESAHQSFFNSSKDINVLHQLGEFQIRKKDFNAALQTYKRYFQLEGKDIKAAYNFAKLLEKAGNKSSAEEYYKFALTVKPDVVQVTVMRAYINFLVNTGQIDKAKKELQDFKPLLDRAGAVVKQEYSRWQKKVGMKA